MKEPEMDAERIGALLDGRVDEPERAELLARLARSDEDYDVFADAASVLAEMEEEAPVVVGPVRTSTPVDAGSGTVEGVTPLRSRADARARRPVGRWLALAAVLAGVALAPLLWSRLRPAEPGDPARLAVLLEQPDAGLPPGGWIDRRPWRVTRGGGECGTLTPEACSARLGALLVDLELAVRARDAASTSRLAGQVEVLLEGVPGSGALAGVYREIGERAGEPPERLKESLERGREAVAGLPDGDYVALGAWAEAGRVAAARRDLAFFRSRESRAALDRLSERLEGNEPARAAVERIRTAVGAEGAPEWGALGGDADEVMRALGS